MKRRTFLKATAATPLVATPVSASEDDVDFEDIAENFFDALPDEKAERNDAVVGCANELCEATKLISSDEIDAIVDRGGSADDAIRRAQFGVRILTEYNLTDAIDESMIESGRRDLGKATRYIPLFGSFNNLLKSACAVETPDPDPEAVTDFIYSSIAFGIEVALWTIGAPYQMAWSGTRFIANRTFLRFAGHGCSGCVAFLMSEIHWAIRASVYGHGVTENRVQFVWEEIQGLQEDAEEWDYEVDLDYSYDEIRELIQSEGGGGAVGVFPQEKEEPLERLLPDFEPPEFDFEIELPSLSDLFD